MPCVSMALRKINVGLEAKYEFETYFKLKVPQSVFRQIAKHLLNVFYKTFQLFLFLFFFWV